MTRKLLFNTFIFIISCFVILSSCKKESFITSGDAKLITADSIKFDIVFTSVGSVTQAFKISNDNNQKLRLTKVKLMGADSSAYRINVNGIASSEVDDIEIAANDSIYVFVSVTIDPTNQNLSFIVQDSILINYNGNNVFVQLQAYGQNAHFLRGQTIDANTTWNNDKPYVILDSLKVTAGKTLNIQKGCRIYSHANAPILIDGTLRVNGTKQDSVVFAGDRIDPDYRDLPAGWPGIYFRTDSRNNIMTYTIVKNAYQAIVAQDPAPTIGGTKLTLHQCIIDNAYDAGILCINSSLKADNCLISNCGSNLILGGGGDYTLTNCTAAAYSTYFISHKKPVLTVTNFVSDGVNTYVADLDATFTNCIFMGDNGFIKDDLSFGKQGVTAFTINMSNCLYNVEKDPDPALLTTNTNPLKNRDPLFDTVDVSRRNFNFHLKDGSPAIDAGASTSFSNDLDNNPRIVNGITDIGCYEKQ